MKIVKRLKEDWKRMEKWPDSARSWMKKYKVIVLSGEMAEWSKAAASKAVISGNRDREFESHSLRQSSASIEILFN